MPTCRDRRRLPRPRSRRASARELPFEAALAESRQSEEQAQRGLRDARRKLDEAAEEASRTTWLAERYAERSEGGSGSGAIKRAKRK